VGVVKGLNLTRLLGCGGWRKTAEGGLETGGRVSKVSVNIFVLEIAPPFLLFVFTYLG
jgi:hypothetical protein